MPAYSEFRVRKVSSHGSKTGESVIPYDLIVVGGGVNGAALARHAAWKGLKVLLWEARDFGFGASSQSSKLIHGGIRYLETGAFGLVRDAVRERDALCRLADPVVRPARFLFPVVPQGRHARWMLKVGMTLYDGLAGTSAGHRHAWVGPDQLRSEEPGLLPGTDFGAFSYSDAFMDDARLVLENLLDAAQAGAEIRNYCRYLGGERAPGDLWEVRGEDRLTGSEVVVEGRRLAFATGAWTDGVAPHAGKNRSTRVRMTQGSHLVVKGLSAVHPLILPVPGSRRYFFVLPFCRDWQEGLHLVGTTEVELAPGTDPNVEATDRECVELLSLLALYYPGDRPVTVCAFAGVRPLAAGGGATASLSREHAFHPVGENAFAAVGGKYTTHRLLASQFLGKLLGEKPDFSLIRDRPFPGSFANAQDRAEAAALLGRVGVPEATSRRWLALYGKASRELAARAEAALRTKSEADGVGATAPDWIGMEMDYAVAREFVKTPVDFLRRRSGLFFTPQGGVEGLEALEKRAEKVSPGYAKTLGAEADYRNLLQRSRHGAA